MTSNNPPKEQVTFDLLLWSALKNRPRNYPSKTEQEPVVCIAVRLGVNTDTLNRWLKGSIPHTSTMQKVASRLEKEFGIPSEQWMNAREYSVEWKIAEGCDRKGRLRWGKIRPPRRPRTKKPRRTREEAIAYQRKYRREVIANNPERVARERERNAASHRASYRRSKDLSVREHSQ